VGNSLGGRVTLELGLAHPGRTRKLALLACSLAWKRRPAWSGVHDGHDWDMDGGARRGVDRGVRG